MAASEDVQELMKRAFQQGAEYALQQQVELPRASPCRPPLLVPTDCSGGGRVAVRRQRHRRRNARTRATPKIAPTLTRSACCASASTSCSGESTELQQCLLVALSSASLCLCATATRWDAAPRQAWSSSNASRW